MPGMEWLRRMLEQAGRDTPAYRIVLVSVGLAVGGVSRRLDHCPASGRSPRWPLWSDLCCRTLSVLRQRAKRMAQFEEQMPEAIDVIQRALKAGHPFNRCLKLVAEDMQDPIAREFELTFADISYGNDPRRALFGLLERVPSVTLTAFITAVLIQRETGGNLAENLGRDQHRHSRPLPLPAPREDLVGRRPVVGVDPGAHAADAVRHSVGSASRVRGAAHQAPARARR